MLGKKRLATISAKPQAWLNLETFIRISILNALSAVTPRRDDICAIC